jgi:hypothetical protein
MASIQPFMKTVFALLHRRLIALGFRKGKYLFTLSISEDVIGTVGLNKATTGRGRGVLEINPVIGVHNLRVGRLVAELAEEEKFDGTGLCLAQANVGYLSPVSDYVPYLFVEGTPPDSLADQLVDAVKTYGLPFIRSNVPLPTLLETMHSTRFGNPWNREYGIPVALYLLGRNSEADAFLSEELIKVGSGTDPASQRFRTFASRLRAEMMKPALSSSLT